MEIGAVHLISGPGLDPAVGRVWWVCRSHYDSSLSGFEEKAWKKADPLEIGDSEHVEGMSMHNIDNQFPDLDEKLSDCSNSGSDTEDSDGGRSSPPPPASQPRTRRDSEGDRSSPPPPASQPANLSVTESDEEKLGNNVDDFDIIEEDSVEDVEREAPAEAKKVTAAKMKAKTRDDAKPEVKPKEAEVNKTKKKKLSLKRK